MPRPRLATYSEPIDRHVRHARRCRCILGDAQTKRQQADRRLHRKISTREVKKRVKLARFAQLYESQSEEAFLKVHVRTLAGKEIISCGFQNLAEKAKNLNMNDCDVVEVLRSDVIPEDCDRPIWNKSLVVTVV